MSNIYAAAGATPPEYDLGQSKQPNLGASAPVAPQQPDIMQTAQAGRLPPAQGLFPNETVTPAMGLNDPLHKTLPPQEPIALANGAAPNAMTATSWGAINQPMLGGLPVDMTTFLPGLQQVSNNAGVNWPVEFQPVDHNPFQPVTAGQNPGGGIGMPLNPNQYPNQQSQPAPGGPVNNNLAMR